jgi:5-methylcytosine-specific restriction endonuclease McrA
MDNDWELFKEYIPVLHNVCLRCDHKWIPKRKDISSSVCPKCNTPLWKQPKTYNGRHGILTKADWDFILLKQGYKCAVCGVQFSYEIFPVRDHIIPLTYRGILSLDNTQALCKSCNSSKSNRIYSGLSGNVWRNEYDWEEVWKDIPIPIFKVCSYLTEEESKATFCPYEKHTSHISTLKLKCPSNK